MPIILNGSSGITYPDATAQSTALTAAFVTANQSLKAWVNFTSTPTITKSYNVTSMTDLGAGYFRVNFTSALADANYIVLYSNQAMGYWAISSVGTSSFEMTTSNLGNSIYSGGATIDTAGFLAVFN